MVGDFSMDRDNSLSEINRDRYNQTAKINRSRSRPGLNGSRLNQSVASQSTYLGSKRGISKDHLRAENYNIRTFIRKSNLPDLNDKSKNFASKNSKMVKQQTVNPRPSIVSVTTQQITELNNQLKTPQGHMTAQQIIKPKDENQTRPQPPSDDDLAF